MFFKTNEEYHSGKFAYDVPGNYWKLDEHKYAELVDASDVDHVIDSDNVVKLLGYGDGHGYTYDYSADLNTVLPIRAGEVGTGNNNATGFINTKNPVAVNSNTVVVGKLNPDIWYKASDGLYHRIASDWELYHKDKGIGDWNFKDDKANGGQWAYVTIPGTTDKVFARTDENTIEYGLDVKETGYLRILDDLNNGNPTTDKVFYSAYRVSTSTYMNSISEAGKKYNTYVRTAAGLNKADAYAFGGRKKNVVNGINVGKFVNEYFEITPLAGYYLDNACVAHRFSTDYHDACNKNTRDFIYENGYWISIDGYDFSDDEIEDAMYCKPGYAWYKGKVYEIIAKDETDNGDWLPSAYVYVASKDRVYNKGLTGDEAFFTFPKKEVADSHCVEVLTDDNTGTVLRPIVDAKDLTAIFEDYNNNVDVLKKTYEQNTTTGRFYLE